MKHVTCNTIKLLFLIILLFVVVNIGVSSATELETQRQAIEKIKAYEQRGFTDYLNDVYRFAIVFAAIIAVVIITISGFQYILAGGNVSAVETAKNNNTQAILGLLLVLASYLILYTINPDLVTKGLQIPTLKIKKTTPIETVVQCSQATCSISCRGTIIPGTANESYTGGSCINDTCQYSGVATSPTTPCLPTNCDLACKQTEIPNTGGNLYVGGSCINNTCTCSQ